LVSGGGGHAGVSLKFKPSELPFACPSKVPQTDAQRHRTYFYRRTCGAPLVKASEIHFFPMISTL
jgi:hypothetical protein